MRDYDFLDLTGDLDAGLIDHIYVHRGAAVEVLESRILFDGTTYPVVSDHPGVLVKIRPGPAPDVTATRIIANIDVGFGNTLFVRGGTSPLDWQAGWPALSVEAGRWELGFSGIPEGESFEYKCLLNDTAYQTGPNVTGLGGAANEVAPQF
jgi:hypothetical protein